MKKNGLYAILAIACFFGYLWLGYSVWSEKSSTVPGLNACFIKQVTGIPCPSCGTTRSVRLVLKGDLEAAVMMNPMGIIVAILMAVIPLWLLFDVVTGKQTLFINYKKAEEVIRLKWVAIVLVFLVIINWTWNIYKHL